MTTSATFFRLLLVSLLCWLDEIHGWGKEGHAIVAQIAADFVQPSATVVLDDYLGPTHTLEGISSVPDSYRSTAQGKWSAPCHYVDLPTTAVQYLTSYCVGFCIVESVQNYTTRLGNGNPNVPCPFASGVEPCPLVFLTHYAGDIHQPLHVGYLGDKGGNDVDVDFFGKRTNLHTVWDTKIIERWEPKMDKAVKALQGMMLADPKRVEKLVNIMNPIKWANESFQLVRTTVYNFTDSGINSDASVPNLADGYYDRNLPIVQWQLIAGGVRLGVLLDTLLSLERQSNQQQQQLQPPVAAENSQANQVVPNVEANIVEQRK